MSTPKLSDGRDKLGQKRGKAKLRRKSGLFHIGITVKGHELLLPKFEHSAVHAFLLGLTGPSAVWAFGQPKLSIRTQSDDWEAVGRDIRDAMRMHEKHESL